MLQLEREGEGERGGGSEKEGAGMLAGSACTSSEG